TPDVDQVEQAFLQPALLDGLAQLEEFAGQLRRLLRGVQSLAHGMSSVCSDDVRGWPDRTKKAQACRSGPGSFVARSDTLRRSHEIPDVHPPFRVVSRVRPAPRLDGGDGQVRREIAQG